MLAAAPATAKGAAEDPPQEARPPESSPFLEVNNSLSVSYLQSHMYYVEPGSTNGGTYLDFENGTLKGARLGVSMMRHWDVDNVYLHAEWSGTEGKVNYGGYFLGGPPFVPAGGQSRSTMQEYSLKLGKGFALGRSWMITPYLGYGRRYWVRELGLGTLGDYNESYSFWYHALGAMVQASPCRGLVLTAEGSIGRTDDPKITVTLPNTGLQGAALGQAVIKKAGAEADYRLTRLLHVFAGFDYMLYNFGQSAVTRQGFFEPFSRTELYEFSLGARVSFSGWHPAERL